MSFSRRPNLLLLLKNVFFKLSFVKAYAHDDGRCHCMEYWECITSGGKPVSYCGPSENQVCCFIPKNAKPVGILPRPSNKRSQCGRKGSTIQSSNDGNAEIAEWPWQVLLLL